jgi:hypothetical protein
MSYHINPARYVNEDHSATREQQRNAIMRASGTHECVLGIVSQKLFEKQARLTDEHLRRE